MRLRNRQSTFSYTFGNPILAKPEVIVAIRRLVQNACEHRELGPLDPDGLRVECVDCGHQNRGVEVAQLVRAAR
jgi:hypothetical protein